MQPLQKANVKCLLHMPLNILCSRCSHTQPLFSVSFSLPHESEMHSKIRYVIQCVWQSKKNCMSGYACDWTIFVENQNKTRIKFGACFFSLLAASSLSCSLNGIFMCRGLFFFKCQRDKFMWIFDSESAFGGYFGSWSHSSCLFLYFSEQLCVSFDKIHIVRLFNYKRFNAAKLIAAHRIMFTLSLIFHNISHNNNYPSN